MTNFTDVGDFHRKFGLVTSDYWPGPQPVDLDFLDFRMKFMEEELQEFVEGREDMDHAKMFDALLDLVYVAMGTAHALGYPWEVGWNAVQVANMAKQRAKADGSDSARGSAFDVVKPPGWTPPRIDKVLASVGFQIPDPPVEYDDIQEPDDEAPSHGYWEAGDH